MKKHMMTMIRRRRRFIRFLFILAKDAHAQIHSEKKKRENCTEIEDAHTRSDLKSIWIELLVRLPLT